MPGDYDIEYASPWAGANYFSVSKGNTKAAEWDGNTWPFLYQLAKEQPDAGVHFQGNGKSSNLSMLTSQGWKYTIERRTSAQRPKSGSRSSSLLIPGGDL